MRSPWVAVDSGTIPAKRARELRDAWEQFIDGRESVDAEGAGTPEVRMPIADSWVRSRDAGVDPSGRQAAPSLLERNGVREQWDAHPLAAAGPVIEQCLNETDLEHLLVVSDADGMLLRIRGDAQLRSRAADEMNFVEGALWSESGAGTNAVGTALAAEHAVQVFAAEHFTESVQRWTCAASPICDPDTNNLLGVIDLTGDFSSVHPHSLSLVIATARAIEELLRGRMHEHDELLRARYAGQSAGAALITGTGRVILDPERLWEPVVRAAIPSGGGTLLLPSGTEAVAEPVEDGDIYIVRPRRFQRRSNAQLVLRLLGDTTPEVTLDGRRLVLRPRHVEMLTLMSLHRGRLTADTLCAELYGDAGHPASVRVEMSRLRKQLGTAIEPDSYGLTCAVQSDFRAVRASLSRGAVAEAAATYPGPLLPHSSAPGIEAARAELEDWMRQAVITSDDAEALWSWVQTPSGQDDLVAWKRLLAALDYEDARRPLAASRTAALRRLYDV
jgi:hypothetical protein